MMQAVGFLGSFFYCVEEKTAFSLYPWQFFLISYILKLISENQPTSCGTGIIDIWILRIQMAESKQPAIENVYFLIS